MNEVSGKVLGLYELAAAELGMRTDELFAGTKLVPGAKVDRFGWEAFCTLGDRLARRIEATGGRVDERLARIGTHVFDVSEMRQAWSIVRWIASPRAIYWASQTWGGPSMFNHLIDLRYEELPDGRLRVHVGIPPGHRDSVEFFHINRGVLQAMPRLLGLADARVEMRIAPRSCTYLIEPPASVTLLARVKQNLRYVVSARDALRELSAQHELLEERCHDLAEARDAAVRARNEAEIALDVAERALEARSEFMATISHEIRTPLNGVLGMTSLLLESPLDPEQTEFAETIRSSGAALLALIDDILDFSRMEAGKLSIEEGSFHLGPLVEEVIDITTSPAHERGVVIERELDPALPLAMRGDAVRLRQVLMNLVGNAAKFTERGTITVRALREGAPERLRVEVEDTGIGIPFEAQPKLFQPFTQADGSTTRRYGGSGLGLAICRQIIELVGGSIGFRSVPGRGSTFWFTVPLVPVVAEVPPQACAAPAFARSVRPSIAPACSSP